MSHIGPSPASRIRFGSLIQRIDYMFLFLSSEPNQTPQLAYKSHVLPSRRTFFHHLILENIRFPCTPRSVSPAGLLTALRAKESITVDKGRGGCTKVCLKSSLADFTYTHYWSREHQSSQRSAHASLCFYHPFLPPSQWVLWLVSHWVLSITLTSAASMFYDPWTLMCVYMGCRALLRLHNSLWSFWDLVCKFYSLLSCCFCTAPCTMSQLKNRSAMTSLTKRGLTLSLLDWWSESLTFGGSPGLITMLQK